MEDTKLRSTAGTTYGSVAVFGCDEGFVWKRGDNTSRCGADGLWWGPEMVCEGKDTQKTPYFPWAENKTLDLLLILEVEWFLNSTVWGHWYLGPFKVTI